MTMREWWANVYVYGDEASLGNAWGVDGHAYQPHGKAYGRFRIHVRLKPEGAPKRYRDGYERWIWEKGIGAGEPVK